MTACSHPAPTDCPHPIRASAEVKDWFRVRKDDFNEPLRDWLDSIGDQQQYLEYLQKD